MRSNSWILGLTALACSLLLLLFFGGGEEADDPSTSSLDEPTARTKTEEDPKGEGPTLPSASDPEETTTAKEVEEEVDELIAALNGEENGSVPVDDLLSRARAGDLDALEYRRALEQRLRKGAEPEAVVRLLLEMKETDGDLLFATSLALSKHLDAAATDRILNGLNGAPDAIRPHLVFALRGTDEPRVDRRLVDLYRFEADPAVRTEAGFVLGGRLERLDERERAFVREQAWRDLTSDEPERMKAGADVLGGATLDAEGTDRLLGILTGDGTDERRLAALRALASAKTPTSRLLPALRRVADDPGAGRELREMARRVLMAHTSSK